LARRTDRAASIAAQIEKATVPYGFLGNRCTELRGIGLVIDFGGCKGMAICDLYGCVRANGRALSRCAHHSDGQHAAHGFANVARSTLRIRPWLTGIQ
jgi:hypothetical protein